MEFIEITFTFKGKILSGTGLLPYYLVETGFEGCYESESGLIAYIPVNLFNRNSLLNVLVKLNLPLDCFTEQIIEQKNWNELWESNFEPVVIDDKCLIKAPFHKTNRSLPYIITIEPKMSFGTGHHETTSLMVSEMLNSDLNNKVVLDAGCGTGILAILAEKMGASDITAIDIDEWSFRNASENIFVNGCNKIKLLKGEAGQLRNIRFDCILANIGLNVLLMDIKGYVNLLNSGGILCMSGILEKDSRLLIKEAEKNGLFLITEKRKNNWALVKFRKN